MKLQRDKETPETKLALTFIWDFETSRVQKINFWGFKVTHSVILSYNSLSRTTQTHQVSSGVVGFLLVAYAFLTLVCHVAPSLKAYESSIDEEVPCLKIWWKRRGTTQRPWPLSERESWLRPWWSRFSLTFLVGLHDMRVGCGQQGGNRTAVRLRNSA